MEDILRAVRVLLVFIVSLCVVLSQALPASANSNDEVGEIRGTRTTPDGALRYCVADGRFDDMHVTSGDLSIHGWWVRIDCPSGTRANLKIGLLKKIGTKWIDVGTQGYKNDVYANGGSSGRANARFTCNGTNLNTFMVWLDVDLIGYADTPDLQYSPQFNEFCGN